MYERIKKLCADKGLSLSALEIRLGFGAGAIGKWKTSCPKADNLALVANALDVSMEYLLSGEEKPAADDGGEVAVIMDYLLSLPTDRLHGILLALEAPKDVLAALDRLERRR